MKDVAGKLQQTLKKIIGKYDDSSEIFQLMVFSDKSAIIHNSMESEEITMVVCTLLEAQEIDSVRKGLYLVPIGTAGKEDVKREDYLPYEGRLICRLAHEAGYRIWLPPAKRWQEAVIIVKKVAIRLLPGNERRREKAEILDREKVRELQAAALDS